MADTSSSAKGSSVDDGDDLRRWGFWQAANRFGARDLVLRGENGVAVVSTASVVVLSATDTLSPDRLTTIATGYLAIGGALFGLVLAGLAVFAAFLQPDYAKLVTRAGVFPDILFEFVWVAALTVCSIGLAIVVLVQTGATTEDGANSTTIGLSTFFFVAALGSGLRLVYELMMQGVLREEYERRQLHVTAQKHAAPPHEV
jgi:hypothetical protein